MHSPVELIKVWEASARGARSLASQLWINHSCAYLVTGGHHVSQQLQYRGVCRRMRAVMVLMRCLPTRVVATCPWRAHYSSLTRAESPRQATSEGKRTRGLTQRGLGVMKDKMSPGQTLSRKPASRSR